MMHFQNVIAGIVEENGDLGGKRVLYTAHREPYVFQPRGYDKDGLAYPRSISAISPWPSASFKDRGYSQSFYSIRSRLVRPPPRQAN